MTDELTRLKELCEEAKKSAFHISGHELQDHLSSCREFERRMTPELVLSLITRQERARNEALEEAAKLCDESEIEARRLRKIAPDKAHKISRTSWINTSQMLGQQIRVLKTTPATNSHRL